MQPSEYHIPERPEDTLLMGDENQIYGDIESNSGVLEATPAIRISKQQVDRVFEGMTKDYVAEIPAEQVRFSQHIKEARDYELNVVFFEEQKNSTISNNLKNFFSLSNLLTTPNPKQIKKLNYRDLTPDILINREGHIGASLFESTNEMKVLDFHVEGPENKDWYFHSVVNGNRFITNHYTVLDDRIIKAIADSKNNPNNQDSVQFSEVGVEELDNFMKATRLYHDRVLRELYNRDPNTGRLNSQLI